MCGCQFVTDRNNEIICSWTENITWPGVITITLVSIYCDGIWLFLPHNNKKNGPCSMTETLKYTECLNVEELSYCPWLGYICCVCPCLLSKTTTLNTLKMLFKRCVCGGLSVLKILIFPDSGYTVFADRPSL